MSLLNVFFYNGSFGRSEILEKGARVHVPPAAYTADAPAGAGPGYRCRKRCDRCCSRYPATRPCAQHSRTAVAARQSVTVGRRHPQLISKAGKESGPAGRPGADAGSQLCNRSTEHG